MSGAAMDGEIAGAVIERAVAGDEMAFARIVAVYHGDMARIAYFVSGDLDASRTVSGELVVGGTVAWTADGRRLLYLVREADDLASSWTIRSIDAAGGGESSVLVRGVQAFDIGIGD